MRWLRVCQPAAGSIAHGLLIQIICTGIVCASWFAVIVTNELKIRFKATAAGKKDWSTPGPEQTLGRQRGIIWRPSLAAGHVELSQVRPRCRLFKTSLSSCRPHTMVLAGRSRKAIMLLTAEIRWFWVGAPPADFEKWFREPAPNYCPAGGGCERTDSYLRDPGQTELGIKLRGGASGLDIKRLIEVSGSRVSFTPSLTGNVELWCKWRTEALWLTPRQIWISSIGIIALQMTRNEAPLFEGCIWKRSYKDRRFISSWGKTGVPFMALKAAVRGP